MPGALSRPLNMRDVGYKYNWRIGYTIAAVCIPVMGLGYLYAKRKRERYDRYFEKMRDPAYVQFLREHADVTPEKYTALIKRLQGEMEPIKAKYGISS